MNVFFFSLGKWLRTFSKPLGHLQWDTGVTTSTQKVGRGQHLWLRSRSSQSDCNHHHHLEEIQGGECWDINLPSGTSPAAPEKPYFRLLSSITTGAKRWQWVHSSPLAKQLVVGLQVWHWDLVALLLVCPPSLENAGATKLQPLLPSHGNSFTLEREQEGKQTGACAPPTTWEALAYGTIDELCTLQPGDKK